MFWFCISSPLVLELVVKCLCHCFVNIDYLLACPSIISSYSLISLHAVFFACCMCFQIQSLKSRNAQAPYWIIKLLFYGTLVLGMINSGIPSAYVHNLVSLIPFSLTALSLWSSITHWLVSWERHALQTGGAFIFHDHYGSLNVLRRCSLWLHCLKHINKFGCNNCPITANNNSM